MRAPIAAVVLLALFAVSARAESAEPPANVAEALGVFDKLCVESGARLTADNPALAASIRAGFARALTADELRGGPPGRPQPAAWAMRLQHEEEQRDYLVTQSERAGEVPALCQVSFNHADATDVRSTFKRMADVHAKSLGGELAAMSKPLDKKPEIQMDFYEIRVPGKAAPAVLSLSTTDTPARQMRHTAIYQAAE